MDHYVKEKDGEKINKYLDLSAEFKMQFRVESVIVLIILRALETVPAKLSESLKKVGNRRRNLNLEKFLY